MRRFLSVASSCFVLTQVLLFVEAATIVRAAEVDYFAVEVRDLDLTEGAWDVGEEPSYSVWNRRDVMKPYVALEGDGEAYWTHANDGSFALVEDRSTWGKVSIRRPHSDADVVGSFYFPKRDYASYARVKFKIAASRAGQDRRKDFLEAKVRHYASLQSRNLPGAAWFRHQAREADLELHGKTDRSATTVAARSTDSFRPWNEFDDTFSLFSGNRAVSENLQLDRVLPAARADDSEVELSTIKGITVDEIDWKKHLAGKKPELDALAGYIPADQHVVFFSSFEAAMALADEADEQGTPLVELAEPQSQDAGVLARYQRQLGLKTTALGRMLGPSVIKSMALTGGDPYFRIGTDLALVFEARDLATLKAAIVGQVTLNTKGEAGLAIAAGKLVYGDEKISYDLWSTPDRTVCSYVTAYGNVVVVSNSLAQVKNLFAVSTGAKPAIAVLDEYRFFRDRYPAGAEDETAFLFLSDATIRRWCGPRWRIGDSRRTRDLAVLAELQAANLPKLADGTAEPGAIHTDLRLSVSGDVARTSAGVYSKTLGSLGFMTPIGELPLERVTKSEADAYGRWRDGYQRNFSWAFDPIALKFTVDDARLAGDLTVMPLIDNTEYREFIAVSRGAKLKPNSGDPHGAAFHGALAINKDSERVKQLAGFAQSFIPQLKVDPLSWLGESIAIYVDDSPLWKEFEKLKTDAEREKFAREHVSELPIALRFEVSSAFKATAFLVAIRGFVEQAGPGMTLWETKQVGEDSYVKISPTAKAVPRGQPEEKLAIYYALTADSLTFTVSEELIKKSLARSAARAAAPADEKPSAETVAWLGESLCLEIGDLAIRTFSLLGSDSYREQMQRLSWGNLPVLNEWKRLYPKQNPVELHERLWGVKLTCPGGGEYVWNDAWQTMESTVYGHPGEQKPGPNVPRQVSEFSRARLGLTFEEQGLRARAELQRRK